MQIILLSAIISISLAESDLILQKTDKTERETGSIDNMELVNPVELAIVAELEFQYGSEAIEAHQQQTEKAMTTDKATKNVPVKNGKSR